MATILIMEDEQLLAEAWAGVLEDKGHFALLTTNANDALEVAKVNRIDLVITDILVRKFDRPTPEGGVLLIGRLRMPGVEAEAPWLKDIPIIAISGAFSQVGLGGPLPVAQVLGADMALVKPVPSETLLDAVSTLLEDKGRPRSRR